MIRKPITPDVVAQPTDEELLQDIVAINYGAQPQAQPVPLEVAAIDDPVASAQLDQDNLAKQAEVIQAAQAPSATSQADADLAAAKEDYQRAYWGNAIANIMGTVSGKGASNQFIDPAQKRIAAAEQIRQQAIAGDLEREQRLVQQAQFNSRLALDKEQTEAARAATTAQQAITNQHAADVLEETKRHNAATEQNARLKKGGGAGGAGGGGYKKMSPEQIASARQQLKNTLIKAGQPEKAAQVDNLPGEEIERLSRGDIGGALANLNKKAVPVGGATHTFDDGSTITLDKGHATLKKNVGSEFVKNKTPEAYASMAEFNKLLQSDQESLKQALTFGKAGAAGSKVLATVGLGSGQVANARSVIDTLEEFFARPLSGAAIGAKEWNKFKSELGAGAFSTPQLMQKAIARLQYMVDMRTKAIFLSGGSAGLALADEYAHSGVVPSHFSEWASKEGAYAEAKRNKGAGQKTDGAGTAQSDTRVPVLLTKPYGNYKAGETVKVRADQAEAFTAKYGS